MLARSGGVVLEGDAILVDDPRMRSVFAPSWMVRLAARLRGRKLDRALSEGADPAAAPQLAAHAARLTTGRVRCGLANALERLASTANEPGRLWGVLPSRKAVAANADELRSLASLLRGPSPVYAQGMAMLRILVSDGTGPAYSDNEGGELAAQLVGVRRAIAG
jgi:hypothetical protein